jgi:hypothetical protein
MSTYIHFTDQQKEQATSTDLAEFLRSQGETLKRSGSEWEWMHDGAKITIRVNKWFHQYDREGSTAVDFVRRFYNKDYPEAVLMLLGLKGGTLCHYDTPQKEKKPFALPEANGDMHRVFAYLMKKRFIDRDVLSFFAHHKLLYESREHHNAIFVGIDENGIARHAHKRGTYSDSSYKGNVDSSNPRFSFHHIGTSDTLCVFEAPIDMISYISLHKENWQDASYVALCCTSETAALYQLEQNPNLQKIRLCLDHDKAGIEACHRIAERLREKGYTDIQFEQPDACKDWNEILKAENGQEAIPAKEHSGLNEMHELCDQLMSDSRYEKLSFDPFGKLTDHAGQLRRRSGNMEFLSEQCYEMALLAFAYAKDRYRQLQIPITDEQLGNKLFSFYRPHKEDTSLSGKLRNLQESVYVMHKQESEIGILTKVQKEQRIDPILRICMDSLCVYSAVGQQIQLNNNLQLTM